MVMAGKKRNTINHDEIAVLRFLMFSKNDLEVISSVFEIRESTLRGSLSRIEMNKKMDMIYSVMAPLDREIGGITIDQLCYADGLRWRRDYPIEDRAVYRTLQYAIRDSLQTDLWYTPRNSIYSSCLHLEGVCKKRFKGIIHGIEWQPLGRIVAMLRQKKLLVPPLQEKMDIISLVYNKAKHDFEAESVQMDDELDSQVYNNLEAISMYFICRKLGVEILLHRIP